LSRRSAAKVFAGRSVAAKKGWATRRRNNAAAFTKHVLRRPGGKNLRRGKPVGYTLKGYRGKRYDFRGLTKAQQKMLLQKVLDASVGHYLRALIVTTNETAYRRLTTSGTFEMRLHLAKQNKNRPYWFWTSEYGPVESTLDAYTHLTAQYDNQSEVGEVRIVIVEII
jgi:hypothetical protein